MNVSAGGVPKLPQPRAEITVEGVKGDRQRDLVHHGGPSRAVCLYSADLIDALRAEGHSITPGAAGENLTVRGVAWESLGVGTRVTAGEVELEITGYANPCRNLLPYFADGRFSRISQKTHPGWSRVYARVLRGGTVAPGDAVLVR